MPANSSCALAVAWCKHATVQAGFDQRFPDDSTRRLVLAATLYVQALNQNLNRFSGTK